MGVGVGVGALAGKAAVVGVGIVEVSRAEIRVRQPNRLHGEEYGASAVTAKVAQHGLHLERKGRVLQANATRAACYLIYEYRQLYCVQIRASTDTCPCNGRSRVLIV
jgi:hypothetical protein